MYSTNPPIRIALGVILDAPVDTEGQSLNVLLVQVGALDMFQVERHLLNSVREPFFPLRPVHIELENRSGLTKAIR